MQLKSMTELVVVDLGMGMAPALAARVLRQAGAQVIRVESPKKDPFRERFPAYEAWHAGSRRADIAELPRLLEQADVCIIGGESHPFAQHILPSVESLLSHEKLVVLDFASEQLQRGKPVVDVLVQARLGIPFEQYGTRAALWACPAPTYGALVVGLIGLLSALITRLETGRGRHVKTDYELGGAMWCTYDWVNVAADHQVNKPIPKGFGPLVFRTKDDKFVNMVMGIKGAFALVHDAIGLPWDGERESLGHGDPARGPKNFYMPDHDDVAARIRELDQAYVLARLREVGIASDSVEPPGAIWDDPQVEINGTLETLSDGTQVTNSPIHVNFDEEAPSHTGPSGADRIRAVDLSAFVAGPFSSKLLADIGADVIKVEPPGGDPMRGVPAAFASANRGKRSIGVNAKHPEGVEIIKRLAATADVVHHNFRPGVTARLGIDPASLRSVAPDLVTLEAPGFGLEGPRVANAAFDPVIQALVGLQQRLGGTGNVPTPYRHPMLDYGGAMFGAIAMLLGIYERRSQQRSVEVSVSLFEAGAFLQAEQIRLPSGEFAGGELLNQSQTGLTPAECLYPTRDGVVAIAVLTDAMAEGLRRALGIDDDLGSFRKWDEPQRRLIAEKFAGLGTMDALAALDEAGVWSAESIDNGWSTWRDDPARAESGYVKRYVDPEWGESEYLGGYLPVMAGAPDPFHDAVGPKMGQHTRLILAELGYMPEEVDALYESGAVH